MPPDDGFFAGHERGSLLEHYEAIAAASRRMLEAARVDDWTAVEREEDLCRRLIGGLARARAAGVRPAERRARVALLRRILADDAQIRDIAEPWLKELDALLAPHRAAGPRA
jgi:flagellar protein FliT